MHLQAVKKTDEDAHLALLRRVYQNCKRSVPIGQTSVGRDTLMEDPAVRQFSFEAVDFFFTHRCVAKVQKSETFQIS